MKLRTTDLMIRSNLASRSLQYGIVRYGFPYYQIVAAVSAGMGISEEERDFMRRHNIDYTVTGAYIEAGDIQITRREDGALTRIAVPNAGWALNVTDCCIGQVDPRESIELRERVTTVISHRFPSCPAKISYLRILRNSATNLALGHIMANFDSFDTAGLELRRMFNEYEFTKRLLYSKLNYHSTLLRQWCSSFDCTYRTWKWPITLHVFDCLPPIAVRIKDNGELESNVMWDWSNQ